MMSVDQGIMRAVTEFAANGDRRAFRIDASLVFQEDFSAFDGHFPGNPVLPGIVQLASVRMLASQFLNQCLVPCRLSNIKFREMIRPGQQVNVRLSGIENGSGWKVSFEINGADISISNGDMLLVPAGNRTQEE